MSGEYPVPDDFGFTAVDSIEVPVEVPAPINTDVLDQLHGKLDTVIGMLSNNPKLSEVEVDDRLKAVENLVMPLLSNLAKNPEKEYILWPNRKAQIDIQIAKLLKLTRG